MAKFWPKPKFRSLTFQMNYQLVNLKRHVI